MSPRPWWMAGDRCDEPEPRECPVCAGCGWDGERECEACNGSGEATGEAEIDGRRACDAWEGLL